MIKPRDGEEVLTYKNNKKGGQVMNNEYIRRKRSEEGVEAFKKKIT